LLAEHQSADARLGGTEAMSLELVIEGRAADVEGTPVTRVLPWRTRRMIGPWTFLDHMGPADVAPGAAMDVRPHPHIGLATVTYLFNGEVVHRDSLGSVQPIRPGDLNWMVAGKGVVHSERTAPEVKQAGGLFHGLQLWVALPKGVEEGPPSFDHYPAASLPAFDIGQAQVRLLAGTGFGRTSPVRAQSPLVYAEIRLPAGATLDIPADHAERGLYIVEGALEYEGATFAAKRLPVFAPGPTIAIRAVADAHLMLLGGAPLEGPRFMWWNFVSSSHDRIEQARKDWRERRFPSIPGDDVEFIPLP
jgi:hypothetical protein